MLLMSCNGHYYTEKQSKALSVSTYAAKDSFDLGRMDLADPYLNQICDIVTPPSIRDRIKIEAIVVNNQKKLLVPARYKNQSVLVVGSDEYNALIKTKSFAKQLQNDNKNLENQVIQVNIQLENQTKVTNQMILDLAKKDKTIKSQLHELWLKNGIIAFLLLICGLKYLKFL